MELCTVEHYWKAQVKLVYALKEGAMPFIPPTAKKELKEGGHGSFSVNEDYKGKVPPSKKMLEGGVSQSLL